MHKTFKYWFLSCAIILFCMIIIGFFRHCIEKFGKNKIVAGIYYFFALAWFVCWAVGLHIRF